MGVSVARNKGIERVRGEYVCFVDADDLLHKDYVSVLVDAIEAQGAEMAACSFKEIRTPEQLKKCKDDVVNIGKSNLAKGVEIYYRTAGYVWNHIFRRSILKNIRFDTEFRTHQDGLFMDEMILKLGECAYTDETAYYYRINASSATKKLIVKNIKEHCL